MRTYEYFSKGFDCNVRVTYNDDGFLAGFEISKPTATSDPKAFFFVNECQFVGTCKQHNIPVVEVERVVTFDMFWERYKKKVDKPEAEAKWAKLSKADQIKAYDYIGTYLNSLGSITQKYAKTYLHNKPWIQ